LARCGCILHHYPENILMPGERRPSLVKSKGIQDLTLCERDILTDALRTNSITVQHITADNAHRAIMASHEPIICGEAPEYDSQNLHGRHAFLNGRINRKGLPRR
ncbi:hypothetical protein EV702DRAFT_940069, partial [Suillus placidus]